MYKKVVGVFVRFRAPPTTGKGSISSITTSASISAFHKILYNFKRPSGVLNSKDAD
jgi:hypothetical protein